MEGRGRVASGTKTESDSGDKAEEQLSRVKHDCMDAGGTNTWTYEVDNAGS